MEGDKVGNNIRKKGRKMKWQKKKNVLTSESLGKVYEWTVYTTTVAAKIILPYK